MNVAEQSSLEDCAGRWHIVATNFPMWLKGDKSDPTFNYRVIGEEGARSLEDRVIYRKHGREKTIAGVSRPVDGDELRFVWRGRGLLSLVRSRWQLFFVDDDHRMAVVVFDKTLFTPAGADIISRSPGLADEALDRAVVAMSRHRDAAEHVDGMLRLPVN